MFEKNVASAKICFTIGRRFSYLFIYNLLLNNPPKELVFNITLTNFETQKGLYVHIVSVGYVMQ